MRLFQPMSDEPNYKRFSKPFYGQLVMCKKTLVFIFNMTLVIRVKHKHLPHRQASTCWGTKLISTK